MPAGARRSLIAAAACLAVVVGLGTAADDFGPLRRLDLDTVLHFEHRLALVDSVAIVLVRLGSPLVFLALSALLVAVGLSLGRRRETGVALIALVGANLTTQLLKSTFANPHLLYEPMFTLSRTNGFPGRDSFPSGHVTAASSLVVATLLVAPRHRMEVASAGLLATAAVALSVVVLGWHFPTDVLGGLLVAAAWGFGALAALLIGFSPVPPGADDRHARQYAHE